jgi:hypothetical protein
MRGHFAGFQEVLDVSLFYSQSLVFGDLIPAIKALCAGTALIMLSLQLKADNDDTLRTTCPMVHLLLRPPDAAVAPGGLGCTVARTIVCTVLQVAYWLRAMAMPAFAGLGAAGNFADSETAQDIILNSVATLFSRKSHSRSRGSLVWCTTMTY